MNNKKMAKFYAVRNGRTNGIFTSWDKCEESVKGFKGAIFKSFSTQTDALAYLNNSKSEPDKINQTEKNLWVDGSFNEGSAGYAVLDDKVVYYGSVKPATNNRGELKAILRGVEIFKQRPLIINSDSQYCIRTLTEWVPNWKSRYGSNPLNWKNSKGEQVANLDLLLKILPLIEEVKFVHVRAHQGNYYNELADYWANIGRNTPKEMMNEIS